MTRGHAIRETHPLAGKTVTVHPKSAPHQELVEGAWWNVSGQSWGMAQGNPACLNYAMRIGFTGGNVPPDDEVVYGKINHLGYLVHQSEIGEEVPPKTVTLTWGDPNP